LGSGLNVVQLAAPKQTALGQQGLAAYERQPLPDIPEIDATHCVIEFHIDLSLREILFRIR
jgi:hypothetical protein